MTQEFTVFRKVQFRVAERSGKRIVVGNACKPAATGRVPRIARLMALAIRFEGLIRSGAIRDQSELARLGHVTRARMTQIMNLLNLAPDLAEAILFLPPTPRGKDPIVERHIRPIAAELDWSKQRQMWEMLVPSSVNQPGERVRNG